jgi:hypothetical protein
MPRLDLKYAPFCRTETLRVHFEAEVVDAHDRRHPETEGQLVEAAVEDAVEPSEPSGHGVLDPRYFRCSGWESECLLFEPRLDGGTSCVGKEQQINFGCNQVDHAGQVSPDAAQRAVLEPAGVESDT